MLNSISISSHLLWLLLGSPVVHAVPGAIYYFISPQCQQNGVFTSADADEALGFTRAAVRRDSANYQAVRDGRPLADPNQAAYFFWIYNREIEDIPIAFDEIITDREQILRYEETSDRSISTLRIECDDDRPGRWQRVPNIPISLDQDPNRPIRNSQRDQNALAPGTVVEYTDIDNRMRETAASNFCYKLPSVSAVGHLTPERDNQGQVEPRYVLTICDMVMNTPPYLWSMNAFMGSSYRDSVLYAAPIDVFSQFKSLLFLYTLYQLPPVSKEATVRKDATTANLADLASIFYLGLRESREFAGAFAWYDLLAGFADRGYIFNTVTATRIEDVTDIDGWTPQMLDLALTGPFGYDPAYVFPSPV